MSLSFPQRDLTWVFFFLRAPHLFLFKTPRGENTYQIAEELNCVSKTFAGNKSLAPVNDQNGAILPGLPYFMLCLTCVNLPSLWIQLQPFIAHLAPLLISIVNFGSQGHATICVFAGWELNDAGFCFAWNNIRAAVVSAVRSFLSVCWQVLPVAMALPVERLFPSPVLSNPPPPPTHHNHSKYIISVSVMWLVRTVASVILTCARKANDPEKLGSIYFLGPFCDVCTRPACWMGGGVVVWPRGGIRAQKKECGPLCQRAPLSRTQKMDELLPLSALMSPNYTRGTVWILPPASSFPSHLQLNFVFFSLGSFQGFLWGALTKEKPDKYPECLQLLFKSVQFVRL